MQCDSWHLFRECKFWANLHNFTLLKWRCTQFNLVEFKFLTANVAWNSHAVCCRQHFVFNVFKVYTCSNFVVATYLHAKVSQQNSGKLLVHGLNKIFT